MAAGDSKLKPSDPILSHRTSISKYTPNLHPMPEELGGSAERMVRCANQGSFFRACVEACDPYELNSLSKEYNVVEHILNHMREHGVPVCMPIGMNIVYLNKALAYGARSSAFMERAFVRKELADNLWSGHVAIFP